MSENLSDYAGGTQDFVTVNGVQVELREFTMRERAVWNDIVEEYGLAKLQNELQTQVIPKISSIGAEIENDPRIMSVQKRLEKLNEKHDQVMDLYATDDEPDDIDEQIDAIIGRMQEVRDELKVVTQRVQDEVVAYANDAENKVSELMKVQDEAKIKFVWLRAELDSEFEQFFSECGTEDYEAADRVLERGNAPWASLYSGRMQEKPKRTNRQAN